MIYFDDSVHYALEKVAVSLSGAGALLGAGALGAYAGGRKSREARGKKFSIRGDHKSRTSELLGATGAAGGVALGSLPGKAMLTNQMRELGITVPKSFPDKASKQRFQEKVRAAMKNVPGVPKSLQTPEKKGLREMARGLRGVGVAGLGAAAGGVAGYKLLTRNRGKKKTASAVYQNDNIHYAIEKVASKKHLGMEFFRTLRDPTNPTRMAADALSRRARVLAPSSATSPMKRVAETREAIRDPKLKELFGKFKTTATERYGKASRLPHFAEIKRQIL